MYACGDPACGGTDATTAAVPVAFVYGIGQITAATVARPATTVDEPADVIAHMLIADPVTYMVWPTGSATPLVLVTVPAPTNTVAVPWFWITMPTGEVSAVPFGEVEKTWVAEFVTVVPW